MFTDAQLQNINACIDFTRRNAPLTGEQMALVGDAMSAVQAEIASRQPKPIPDGATVTGKDITITEAGVAGSDVKVKKAKMKSP